MSVICLPEVKQIRIPMRTYRCPVCKEVVLRIPMSYSVPSEEEEILCPNGHKVKVPKFKPVAAI